jgi:hypothetical protein
MIFLLKLGSSLLIGKSLGQYFRKNELSPILGIGLTVALTLLVCVLIDKVLV